MKSALSTLALCGLALALNLAAAPAEAADPNGTRVCVKNGTNRTLVFDLFVTVAGRGTGKFDSRIRLQPGDTAVWNLPAGYQISAKQKEGHMYYKVGLVGEDPTNGK